MIKNIIFIGTNFFAAKILENMIIDCVDIILIITKENKQSGRGMKYHEFPVKSISKKYNKNYLEIRTLNEKYVYDLLKDMNPNIIIMTDFGDIISQEIILLPKYGIYNIHPSILPDLRGPTPIHSAILFGYNFTGISIIKINKYIDSGDIIFNKQIKIGKNDTYILLMIKLVKLSKKIILKFLTKINKNRIRYIKQNENLAIYTQKINNDFFRIDWNTTAKYIERKIRSLIGIRNPYFKYNNKIIKIITAKIVKNNNKYKYISGKIININKHGLYIGTSKNILKINKILIEGKSVVKIKDLLNSNTQIFKKNEYII
jgi:methionyl-tRNA formyltransferase